MAGVPDLNLSDTKPAYSIAQFREDCEETLSEPDKKLLYYYFLRWDCVNLVKLLRNPDETIDLYGNFRLEQYQDLITSARELTFNVHRFPAFMSIFAREYPFNKDKKGYFAEDDILYQYIQYVIKNCSNSMIVRWYKLMLDINNILSAMIARKNGWAVADYIQGDNEVTDMIRTNSTRDFDLSLEFDYVKELMKIVDDADPVQKERRIDAFKWVWLDEQTFYNPFSMEAVFAYFCKLEMLYRWERLDPEQGKEAFKHIIDSLRGEAQVPDEFRTTGPKARATHGAE